MATVIYRCKKCKKGRRVEYPEGNSLIGFYRRDAKGRQIRAGAYIAIRTNPPTCSGDVEMGVCPHCRTPMKSGILKATFSSHRACDARCTHATGADCVCSCGGANHGIHAGF